MSALTVKERQYLAREDAIVETAYELLSEQGYEKMNMDELAKQVGIAKATLYQHFPSKEDLLVGVVVRMMRRGEEDLFSEVDPHLSAMARLDQGLRRSLTHRIGIWHGSVGMTNNPRAIKNHPRYRTQVDRMFARLSELIDQGKAEGDINPELSTTVIIHALMGLFQLNYEALLQIKNCPASQAVESLVTMTINGIKAPSKWQAEFSASQRQDQASRSHHITSSQS